MSPLPVARKESASLPASRLAMMLPNEVETRIPPAMLLTLMPPAPLSHCTPHAAPTFTGPAILRAVTMPLADFFLSRPAGTMQPPPHRTPPNIAAAGHQLAIPADAVRREFPGAGIA